MPTTSLYDHRLTYTEEWKGRGYPGNGGRREEIKEKKNWFDMGPDWNHKNYFNSLTIQSIKQLTPKSNVQPQIGS